MTVQEIKDFVLNKLGFKEVPDKYVLQFVNEIMDSLTMYDSACKKATNTIITTKGTWTDLPSNCIAVKRCFKNDNEYNYDNFIIENGQIQFKTDGTYSIEYLALQDHVTTLSEVPGVSVIFHEALALGVAYKESCRVFMYDNDTVKVQLFGEYTNAKETAKGRASNSKRSRKRITYADFF